jgi:hypothetical protein
MTNSVSSGRSWRQRRLSRRAMLRAAAGAAAGSAAVALSACRGDGAQDSPSVTATATDTSTSSLIGPVEQQKQLRLGAGLTGWDPSQTYDGYTLFSPTGGASAYLIDMRGEIVHTWDIIEPSGILSVQYVNLLENGNIMARIYKPAGDAPVFVWKGGVLMEVDWQANVLWQFEDPAQHHDARLLPNGNLLLLRTELTPPDVAARVQGGVPGSDGDGMWCDWVAEVTLAGETVWEWHAWEHLDPENDRMNPQDLRNEWTHGNSVEQMPDGNILISFRNINTVAIVERESGDIIWRLGAPNVAQQHDPTYLPNGNILIFDNGAHRLNVSLPFSRVIEVNPETSEIVWRYSDPAPLNFFSPFISGAQRLPNGNTFVTEGNFGRLFELTPEKEIVWEYINPFVTNQAIQGDSNAIFRAYRYGAEAFPQLQS